MHSDAGHLYSSSLCREGQSDLANTKEVSPAWLSRAGLPGQLPTKNAPSALGPFGLTGPRAASQDTQVCSGETYRLVNFFPAHSCFA